MIEIKAGDIRTALMLSRQIPEFVEPAGEEEYHKRLDGKRHLILIALDRGKPVGFKAGYEKEDHFYSWMGGVLPEYRRKGIARKLAETQEAWARKAGYQKLVFKTRNQHKGMLVFALKNGFDIVGFTAKEKTSANRILLKKVL
jgi:GNAT superfamily N-acetyltransferase